MNHFTRTKYGCYFANMSQAAVANITPLLFIPLRETYNISYTLLGALVLINFITQLIIDLIFSIFSDQFNIKLIIKITPVITLVGMISFALAPVLFPKTVYAGLVLGTIISSSSSGLVEVLVSPIVAAIPSNEPEKEMSILHSIYAWGVVIVVILSTAFLWLFGNEKWQWLLIIWSIIPFITMLLFFGGNIPDVISDKSTNNIFGMLKKPYFVLCLLCIFFGGAAECTMAQWSSSYLEKAVHINKVMGDVFGVAMFGLFLGLGRTIYAKYGKNIYRVLLFGAIFATACYLLITFTNMPMISLVACTATGFFVSMMWPGSLLAASNRFEDGGVMMFAMLAAAGDLGASVGPWFVGRVTDLAISSRWVIENATVYQLTTEQLGLKIGLLSATIFPIMAIVVYGILFKLNYQKKNYK